MFKRTFTLQIEIPPSVNHYLSSKVRNGKVCRFPSSVCKIWKESFYKLLRKYRDEFSELTSTFDSTKNYLAIIYTFYIPRDILMKKKGGIKARRNDLCNLFKIPNDVLSEFIGIDDALIGTLIGNKKVSQDGIPRIKLTIISVKNDWLD